MKKTLLALALILFMQLPANSKALSPTDYNYSVVTVDWNHFDFPEKHATDALVQASGQQGWEMTNVLYIPGRESYVNDRIMMFFRRPKAYKPATPVVPTTGGKDHQ